MRKIAVSDIHGCLKTFKALIEHQVEFTKKDELYLLGDYIDRGPDSKGVLDYVMNLQEAGYKVFCVKGNHEEMMVNAVQNNEDVAMWLYNGGQESLASFGTEDPGEIPPKYLNFIHNMAFFYEVDEYILVHAGLNFVGNSSDKEGNQFLWKMHNPLTDLHSMLWIRWWYEDIDWNWLQDRVVVHGHTPIVTNEIWDMYDYLEEDQVLDIDNGCFARYKEGMGQLCAFDLVNRDLFFQVNIE
ncbi:MAG: serine/threonine protein phosphatase [Bacteroidetes bacterium]|nr:serine/threonine protein phosphatase [Bacteroidota bacterium]